MNDYDRPDYEPRTCPCCDYEDTVKTEFWRIIMDDENLFVLWTETM